MESNYELQIDTFRGPLDKLLELIEARQMPITSLSLATVTADFLEYLKTLSDIQPKLLADFVAVASKLILIKSHTLLPQLELAAEEKEEMAGLEEKLRIYKELKLAEKNIKSLWAKNISFGREFMLNSEAGFYLSQPVTPNDLLQKIAALAEELTAIFSKNEEGSVKLINFEAKMKELMERVDKTISSSFNEIVRGKEKAEVVVLFLAILHLLKDSMIKITQSDNFSDMEIVKNTTV